MKKLFILTCIALLGFSACSDDDDNNNILRDAKLKLVASKTQIEPFQDIKVSISNDIEVLRNAYDSIVWETKSTAYGWGAGGINFDWRQDDSRDMRVTSYKIGKHNVYAKGYKDGIATSIDSIEYEVVKPTGDFLSTTWKSTTKDEYLRCTYGQTPVRYYENYTGTSIYGGVSLELNHIVEDAKTEYITFEFMPWSVTGSKILRSVAVPDLDDFDWTPNLNSSRDEEKRKAQAAFEYKFMHNYLVDLYGEPNYIYDGDDVSKTNLQDEYNKRFDKRYQESKDYYPCEIWDTPTSYIALIRPYNGYEYLSFANGRGVVVAQPRYK